MLSQCSEFQRTEMRSWERMQNSRGGKKEKNATAFVVKGDFLYCQTARALVIPSNMLQESGKIWKSSTLHKERRLKHNPPQELLSYVCSNHINNFCFCSVLMTIRLVLFLLWSMNHCPQKMRRRSTLMRKKDRILTFSIRHLIFRSAPMRKGEWSH